MTSTVLDERALEKLHQNVVAAFADVFAITARALDQVVLVETTRAYAAMHYQTTAHYLSSAIGLSLGTAREHVRVAKALSQLPLLHAALTTASQLEKIVRGCRKVTSDEAKKQAESRQCACGFDDEGMFFMRVRLLADEGARVMQVLERALPMDSSVGTRSLSERQADALMAIMSSETEAAQTEVIVHLQADSAPAIETPLSGNVAIANETAKRLCCDASVVRLLKDKDGSVLDVGRRTRQIPAAIRRALKARDKGCRFPGCANTKVDAHHLRAWQEGGETKLDNLAMTCRFHHRMLHEGGYSIRIGEKGELCFVNPRGIAITAPKPLPESSTLPLMSTAPWPGTGWWSQRMDYGYVVSQISHRLAQTKS